MTQHVLGGLSSSVDGLFAKARYIPIILQDASSNVQLAANFKRFSIAKPHNTISITAVFLNQNV